jgi:hypothetical protein
MERRPATGQDRQPTAKRPLKFQKRAWDRYAIETAGIFNRNLAKLSGRPPALSEPDVDLA